MSLILNKNDIVEINKREEYIVLSESKCQNMKTNEICDINYLKNKEIINIVAIQEEFSL